MSEHPCLDQRFITQGIQETLNLRQSSSRRRDNEDVWNQLMISGIEAEAAGNPEMARLEVEFDVLSRDLSPIMFADVCKDSPNASACLLQERDRLAARVQVSKSERHFRSRVSWLVESGGHGKAMALKLIQERALGLAVATVSSKAAERNRPRRKRRRKRTATADTTSSQLGPPPKCRRVASETTPPALESHADQTRPLHIDPPGEPSTLADQPRGGTQCCRAPQKFGAPSSPLSSPDPLLLQPALQTNGSIHADDEVSGIPHENGGDDLEEEHEEATQETQEIAAHHGLDPHSPSNSSNSSESLSDSTDIYICSGTDKRPSRKSRPSNNVAKHKSVTKPRRPPAGAKMKVISEDLLATLGISAPVLPKRNPGSKARQKKVSKVTVAKESVRGGTRGSRAGLEVDPDGPPRARSRLTIEMAQSTPRVLPCSRNPAKEGISSSAFTKVLRLVTATTRSSMGPKQTGQRRKTPTGRPPVWAQSRQELCEAVTYYRAFQSGMYMFKRTAYGYLLDGFPTRNDAWADEGRVIISHGGGQAIRTIDANGKAGVALAADHTPADMRIDTLIQAANRRVPVILLVGEGYALLPWKLGCTYAVLGWYWVSATWYEAEPVAQGIEAPKHRDWFNRLKVRFDWVQSQGEPWWLGNAAGPGSEPVYDSATVIQPPDKPEPRARAYSPSVPVSALPPTPESLPASSCLEDTEPCPLPSDTPQLISAQGEGGPEHVYAPSHERFAHECLTDQSSTVLTIPPTPELSRDLMQLSHVPLPDGVSTDSPVPPRAPQEQLPETLSQASEVQSGLIAPSNRRESEDQDPALLQELLWAGKPRHLEEFNRVSPCRARYASPLNRLRGNRRPGQYRLTKFHDVTETVSGATNVPVHTGRNCPSCTEFSPHLYVEERHLVNNEEIGVDGLWPIPPGMRLTYCDSFLTAVPTPAAADRVPYSVVPPLPSSEAPIEAGQVDEHNQAGSRTQWKGWVCTLCGRANCRYRWEMWECVACGLQLGRLDEGHVIPGDLIPPGPMDVLGEAELGSRYLRTQVRRLGSSTATVVSYELPDAGTIYHVMHDSTTAMDDIWRAYQTAAINTGANGAGSAEPLFQRRALKSHTVKGQMLSQQFAINSGASYKYIVETLSYTLEESPSCVGEALQLIRSVVKKVLGELVPFNEVLSVMYREGQKMNWHDDGESGLGPVVAALSLGSPAVMSFRPKSRRRRKCAEAQPRATEAPVLHLTLSHGDIIIMAGRPIQFMYDHKVVPMGLRVAATARVIESAATD